MRRVGLFVVILCAVAAVSAYAAPIPLTPPSDLLAVGGPGAVTLTWIPGGDSEAQIVYREELLDNGKAGYWRPQATLGPLESGYVDVSAEPGKVYAYVIMARDYSGEYRSANSNMDSAGLGTGAALFPPIYLRARYAGRGNLGDGWTHMWTVSATNVCAKASGYEVYRSLDGAPFEIVGTMLPGAFYRMSFGSTYWQESEVPPEDPAFYLVPVASGSPSVVVTP